MLEQLRFEGAIEFAGGKLFKLHRALEILRQQFHRISRVAFAVNCPSADAGAAPGVASQSFICIAASACRTRFISSSRAVPGGNSSAAFRNLAASSASRCLNETDCLMRRRIPETPRTDPLRRLTRNAYVQLRFRPGTKSHLYCPDWRRRLTDYDTMARSRTARMANKRGSQ